MSTMTVGQAQERFGVRVESGIGLDDLVPVVDGLQFQGDVSIVPAPDIPAAVTPIPQEGVAVVIGELGGNTHSLMGDGTFDKAPVRPGAGSLTLGTLTVPEGGTAYMTHPGHGYAGISAGTYRIGRQREMADEIRMVAD